MVSNAKTTTTRQGEDGTARLSGGRAGPNLIGWGRYLVQYCLTRGVEVQHTIVGGGLTRQWC